MNNGIRNFAYDTGKLYTISDLLGICMQSCHWLKKKIYEELVYTSIAYQEKSILTSTVNIPLF